MVFQNLQKFLIVLVLFQVCSGKVLKREASGISYNIQHQGDRDDLVGWGWNSGGNYYGATGVDFSSKFDYVSSKSAYNLGPSPGEIASAISAAKEASAAVVEAQKRVQIAKDDVIHQQQVATHKEAEAALALQRAEAAAAVHRQQASAAANAVIYAQQRLAQAKADVSEKQKMAAGKEAEAASAIQQSAVAAAIQVQKSDYNAAKLAALQHSGTSATLKHAAAAKEATLGATSAALAATKGFPNGHQPWNYAH